MILKHALLICDVAYDYGLGRFDFSLQPALFISEAAYDLGLGRFAVSFLKAEIGEL